MQNAISYPKEILEIAQRIVEFGAERGITVGTAESCTGGLVAGALTEVPGSSSVVLGGVVSYSELVKHDVLGVSSETIQDPGVVSHECAREMAEGARNALGCDVAVSITGIAGPGGEEPGKPVGTVFFGSSSRLGVRSYRELFAGNRVDVRTQAVRFALERIYEGMVELSELPNA